MISNKRILFPAMVFVLLTLLVSGMTAAAVTGLEHPATSQPWGQEAHYFVFRQLESGRIQPISYRHVRMASPLPDLQTDREFQLFDGAGRNHNLMRVTLERDGEAVFQNVARAPRWLRGEFHGRSPLAPIDGHLLPEIAPFFVVRVPVIPDTVLVLNGSQGPASRFAIDELIAKLGLANSTLTGSDASTSIATTGSPANRVDFLIMGDGYTAAQTADFAADAQLMADQFFGISPFAEYTNYVNVHTLFIASTESGADHPPYLAGCSRSDPSCCGDSAMLSDPLQGTFVETAFDARYCTANIHRLLTINTGAALTAAAAVPDWDEILMLVNDTTYGGSGGTIATTSMHPTAVEIAQHEYGHSFVDLADEYETPFPGFPPCSDLGGTPCEANVTDQTDRAQIKWSPWISDTTPVPTEPEFDPLYEDVVGLFKGARYLASDMYRPGQNCLMRSLGRPFCQVPSQAYVFKLYEGGWGVPAAGISMIEPGTPLPASATVTVTFPATQTFQADILQPIGGPLAEITWLLDGAPVAASGGTVFTLDSVDTGVGVFEVRLRVADTTPLVHPAMAGNRLVFAHMWTLHVVEGGHGFVPMVRKP